MSELAVDGSPVAVTCRVLKLARQPYYRWLVNPDTTANLVEAYRANALFDAHRVDPQCGHRFLFEEARDAEQPVARQTAWRICLANGWFSVFSKKHQGKNIRSGPPVHDDDMGHNFTVRAANRVWLSTIIEKSASSGTRFLVIADSD